MTMLRQCCRGSQRSTLWLIPNESMPSTISHKNSFVLSHPTTTASHLEAWLSSRLASKIPNGKVVVEAGKSSNPSDDDDDDDDDEAVVIFATRYDAHWLQCYVPPMMTILGLYEETGNPNMIIQQSYWHVRGRDDTATIAAIAAAGDDSVATSSCQCQPLHSEWKRRNVVTNVKDGTSKKDKCDGNDNDNVTTSLSLSSISLNNTSSSSLQWIDFRSIPANELDYMSTPSDVWHCMTSLLGNRHVNNPWVDDHRNDGDTVDPSLSPSVVPLPDMIVFILPHTIPTSALRNFRVSDACPSWFFHGCAFIEDWPDTTTTITDKTKGPVVLYMYKRLSARVRLSERHPETGQAMPESMAGCLWQMIPPKNEDGKDDHENHESGEEKESKGNSTQASATVPPPRPSYHPVSPPYLSLEQEYGTDVANGLLSPKALQIFRQEALAIPQWTPWPETQHYSVGPNGETKTWTVFPLCYCFPSHDVSQRTWVESTRRCCPRTCQLLESILGDTVRTALFSRLKPNTVLEAHTGWADLANSVLRLHIPLIVPNQPTEASNAVDPNDVAFSYCGTWVDGCVETHQVGRPLLFDDSKIHRAFNYHPTESRIVLIVDLARPDHLPKGLATGGHSDELDHFIGQMMSGGAQQ